MIQDKHIFITGGAGFIASAFIARTVEKNKVIAFDNLERNALINMPFLNHPNLKLVEGNVLDFDHLRKAMHKDTDIVIHCAAIAGIVAALKNPVDTIQVNMLGTVNLLKASTFLPNCERVICFSSSEIYGRQAIRPKESDDSAIGSAGIPHWAYAASKLAEEHLTVAYFQEMGLPTTVIRPFNVYGPGQVGDGALRKFILQAIRNQPLEIHRDGAQIRSWCYVEDMIDALILVIKNPLAIGETFNIGNSKSVISIFELAKTIIRELNSSSPIVFTQDNYTDVDLRIPDTQKSLNLLGFEPKIDLEEGIQRTADFYRRITV